MPNHYFSLQFSAIQKSVLRHDRLWSIAGISNILSRLNEIEMPEIAETHHGQAIVAGGGKFTARFANKENAEKARRECVKLVSTTLPMLEFQVSEKIWSGPRFSRLAADEDKPNPAVQELNEQKRQFRGYAVSFNPHLKVCEECGEYPAVKNVERWRNNKKTIKGFCRICLAAFEESRRIFDERKAVTTLQKVYHRYLRDVPEADGKNPAADFNDLFPPKDNGDDERKRMASFFSDLNNMNERVPVWLRQKEDEVLATFDQFRDTVVDLVAKALAGTFPNPEGDYLPFRLVVAGGDDLCLVMAEKHILAFTRNLSQVFETARKSFPQDHPLSDAWLKANRFKDTGEPKPFGFGASFVVTSIHTPFSQIHQVGEELMSAAKKGTDRQGNSVNWRIMAEENSVTEKLLQFERPLFIEAGDRGKNERDQLTFADYLKLRDEYWDKNKHKEIKKLSGSHLQQIVGIMQELGESNGGEINPWELDRRLKLLDAAETDKSFSFLLRDARFRDGNDMLLPRRIATLFELMTIAGGDQ